MTSSSQLLRVTTTLWLILATVHAFAVVTPPNGSQLKTSSELNAAKSASLTLFSPCKINLFLRILGKRDDGYHDLASLFQAVGFGDTLDLTVVNEDSDIFTCNMPGVPVDETNLVLRALALMRLKTGVRMYFNANLYKECPAQAGLGGGSANAATAMYAANELMGKPATLEQVSLSVCIIVYIVCCLYMYIQRTYKYCVIDVPLMFSHHLQIQLYSFLIGVQHWEVTLHFSFHGAQHIALDEGKL